MKKTQAFPAQYFRVAAWTQQKPLRGLRHISLLTNPSHHSGNTLFGFTYIHLTLAPEITHQRGLERLTLQIHSVQCKDPFDGQRSHLLDYTCGLSNHTYSAPGVAPSPYSRPLFVCVCVVSATVVLLLIIAILHTAFCKKVWNVLTIKQY